MIIKQRKLNLLVAAIALMPLFLQMASSFYSNAGRMFLINSCLALLLIFILFLNNFEDLDQYFLEKTNSYLSIVLAIMNWASELNFISINQPSYIFQLAAISYACSLYFTERHFNIKNILVIALNMNVMAMLMPPAGSILIGVYTGIAILLYFDRFLITYTEQFRLLLLIVYLVLFLISLIWLVPELPDFSADEITWQITAVSLVLVIPVVLLLLGRQTKLKVTSHLIFGTLIYLFVTQTTLVVAQNIHLNTLLVVFALIYYLSIVNIFGNITLNKNQHKISIIVPVTNSAPTIVETLESIKKQTYQDWEVLLIDIGSTDDTLEVLKRYLRYNKLSVKLIQKRGYSLTQAVKASLSFLTGDICVILQKGDVLYDQNVFYRATSTLRGEKCDGIFVGYQVLASGNLVRKTIRPKTYYPSQAALVKAVLSLKDPYPNSIFWVRKSLEKQVNSGVLMQGYPQWYDAELNRGLNLVNGNFIGLKRRTKLKKTGLTWKDFQRKWMFLTEIISRIRVPLLTIQGITFNFFDQHYLSTIYPVFFKHGKSSLKKLTHYLFKRYRYDLNDPLIKTVYDFANNYHNQKTSKIKLPKNLKLYSVDDQADLDEHIRSSQIVANDFYVQIIELLKDGTTTLITEKDDVEKLSKVVELFGIKNYVKVVSD